MRPPSLTFRDVPHRGREEEGTPCSAVAAAAAVAAATGQQLCCVGGASVQRTRCCVCECLCIRTYTYVHKSVVQREGDGCRLGTRGGVARWAHTVAQPDAGDRHPECARLLGCSFRGGGSSSSSTTQQHGTTTAVTKKYGSFSTNNISSTGISGSRASGSMRPTMARAPAVDS